MDEPWTLRRFNSQFAMMMMMCLMCRHVGLCEGFSLFRFRERVVSESFEALSNWESIDRRNGLCSWLGVGCLDEKAVTSEIAETKGTFNRRFLRVAATRARNFREAVGRIPSPTPSPSPAPSPLSLPSSPSPSPTSKTPISSPFPSPESTPTAPAVPASAPSLSRLIPSPSTSKHNQALIILGAIGGFVIIALAVLGIIFWRGNKVATVRPWATGLSGQLQKAFVTGVPNLNRSELETACEDFSNVVGTSSVGTVFKGTLSNGVEIAVISIAVTAAKDWTKNHEAQFRKKIRTLSKVNHKNFVNLVGYCEEDEPFTRMMVFEYAPNGTLFEHLHIKDAEHLDWAMRLRIAMGVAYCLEQMHQLTPPMAHSNLNSSVVNLTEDYAAKLSDFSFYDGLTPAQIKSPSLNHLNPQFARLESNVYSYGLILFEMVTGRVPPYDGPIEDYLKGCLPLQGLLDQTLSSYKEEQLERISEVIKSCLQPHPKERPTMRKVVARLREITEVGPDGAIPKLSPLWWAELEVLSMEAS